MFDVSWLRSGVIVVLALTIGGVAAVMRLHYRAWRNLPRHAGLTPLHVTLVSLGVLIWGGSLAWALIESLGREATATVTIRTVLYGVGGVTILAALVIVAGLQRRRVQFAREQTTVTVHEDLTESVRINSTAPPPDKGAAGPRRTRD